MKKKRKKKQASDGRKDGRWDSITRRTILAWPVIVRRVEFSWFGTLSTVSRYAAFRSPRDLHVIDNPFFQLCSSIGFGVNGCELLGMNRVHKVSKVSISSTDSWSSNRPHDFLLI